MTVSARLQKMLKEFENKQVMVLGDVMIDAYLWGQVERISPEAPVPVVALHRRESRLGGAANVALNLQALGAKPILCSVIGDDRQGDIFLDLMESAGLDNRGIIRSPSRITTTKFRVLGNQTQMLRVDEEHTHDLTGEEEIPFLSLLEDILQQEKIDVIIFQDYNKGVLSKVLITKIIAKARDLGIPTCVDPKKNNFETFRGVSLFKPNLKELKEGLKMDFDAKDPVQLESAISILQDRQNIEHVLLTLSEEGVMIRSRQHPQDYLTCLVPAHRRAIADVSGAGDTVISVAALCLATQASPSDLATFSNLAGGLVCEEVGVVPVNPERLRHEISQLI